MRLDLVRLVKKNIFSEDSGSLPVAERVPVSHSSSILSSGTKRLVRDWGKRFPNPTTPKVHPPGSETGKTGPIQGSVSVAVDSSNRF